MIGHGIVLAAHLAGLPVCAAPLDVTLNERDTVQVAVVFACAGARGTLKLRRGSGRELVHPHAFTRGSVRVDRGGAKTLRLIDQQERANDLLYRDGAVELWRSGQRVWRKALTAPASGRAGS